jgi:hypothetical protein
MINPEVDRSTPTMEIHEGSFIVRCTMTMVAIKVWTTNSLMLMTTMKKIECFGILCTDWVGWW